MNRATFHRFMLVPRALVAHLPRGIHTIGACPCGAVTAAHASRCGRCGLAVTQSFIDLSPPLRYGAWPTRLDAFPWALEVLAHDAVGTAAEGPLCIGWASPERAWTVTRAFGGPVRTLLTSEDPDYEEPSDDPLQHRRIAAAALRLRLGRGELT